MEKFEEIINQDEDLNALLRRNEITVFSNFSKKEYSPELIDYIQESYFQSFQEIIVQSEEGKNGGKITALLRSVEYLATPQTKDRIVEVLLIPLEKAEQHLKEISESMPQMNAGDFITLGKRIDKSLNSVTINIFNKFDDYAQIEDYRNKIVKHSLDICKSVAGANPKRETFKYAVYNVVINNLEKIKRRGPLKERFQKHHKNISQKRTGIEVKYWAGIVITIILIILKILSRF